MSATEVMERYVGAIRRGDFDAAFAMFAPDIVFTIPGRSRFAGERRGREAAMEYIDTVRALSHEAGIEVEVLDALTSEERFALIVVERLNRDGGQLEVRRANVYRVRGDEIVEIFIFEGDQYAVDALLGG